MMFDDNFYFGLVSFYDFEVKVKFHNCGGYCP